MYIYIIYIRRATTQRRPLQRFLSVCLFFLWYIGSSVQQKASQVSSIYNIYIYFFMYKGRSWYLFSRSAVHLRRHISYHMVKDRSQEFVKSPSARNGQRRSCCPLCNRLQGYWKPGRTNLGAICQWAANDCPCMECGGPC